MTNVLEERYMRYVFAFARVLYVLNRLCPCVVLVLILILIPLVHCKLNNGTLSHSTMPMISNTNPSHARPIHYSVARWLSVCRRSMT